MTYISKLGVPPADDVKFELTLTESDPNPMQMVANDGYDARNWSYQGIQIMGTTTKEFRLITLVAYTLDEARMKAIHRNCRLADGIWREAFRKAFPKPNKGEYVAFGGTACLWIGTEVSKWCPVPYSSVAFPYLFEDGKLWRSGFSMIGPSPSTDQGIKHWLVEDDQ